MLLGSLVLQQELRLPEFRKPVVLTESAPSFNRRCADLLVLVCPLGPATDLVAAGTCRPSGEGTAAFRSTTAACCLSSSR